MLDEFSVSLLPAYDVLSLCTELCVPNSMHDPFCKICQLVCSIYRIPFIMHVSSWMILVYANFSMLNYPFYILAGWLDQVVVAMPHHHLSTWLV